jgi:hypothetical protein
MQSTSINQRINEQKLKVFSENPEVQLIAPCVLGNGIVEVTNDAVTDYKDIFEKSIKKLGFFIPASGSGSRMFQFLQDFLVEPTDENRSLVEKFFNNIEKFAFFNYLPIEIQTNLKNKTQDIHQFISFLLTEDGLNYAALPKGLIPFHVYNSYCLNPFQELIIQSKEIKKDCSFYFTIQAEYEAQIKESIQEFVDSTIKEVAFSEQEKKTNSFAFKNDETVLMHDNGEYITRPAGHGALLNQLNAIDEEVIFVKNIDNIQHQEFAESSTDTLKVLGGILHSFKEEAREIVLNPTLEGFKQFCIQYHLLDATELESILNEEQIIEVLNRPIRICGMVKNDGQPGGGPFWVQSNGVISKQIVEKSQISLKGEQYHLMAQSSHFNPVMIALSTKDLNGTKIDLTNYKDDNNYFIVHKKHNGIPIRFIELPGLWNGGMAFWNTVFVEVPSESFSPVKSVLDLLEKEHQTNYKVI